MNRKLNILLVEDNPGDVLLIKKALSYCPYEVELQIASDGAEALEMLNALNDSSAIPPQLILLDLNLPKTNGQEVLRRVKTTESLKQIPVVVVTTSRDEKDIQQCYHNHANAYLTKPIDIDDYFEMINEVTRFWGAFVNLPPN